MSFNRRLSNDINPNEFQSAICAIENLLGKKWLENNKHYHPIKNLWARRDFLASIELLTLGKAIEAIDIASNQSWIDDFARQLKSYKNSDIQGATYEAIASLMFRTDKHDVILSNPNQPGYDFRVVLDDLQVNVSCKKLQVSDKEKQLKSDFNYLNSYLKRELTKRRMTGVHIFLYSEKPFVSIDKKKLLKEIINFIDSGKSNGKVCDYDISIKKISCDNEGFKLSEHSISYQLNLVSKYSNDEEQRFKNLFRKATKNISKHSYAPDKNIFNAIMIGLPPNISIKSAKNWLKNRFKNNGSKITFAIITKLIPATNLKDNTTFMSIEIEAVFNPNACDSIKGNMFSLSLPIGKINTKGLKNIILSPNGQIDISTSYNFQKGKHSYQHVNGGPMEIKFSAKQGIEQEALVDPNKSGEYISLTPVFPPENNFNIL